MMGPFRFMALTFFALFLGGVHVIRRWIAWVRDYGTDIIEQNISKQIDAWVLEKKIRLL